MSGVADLLPPDAGTFAQALSVSMTDTLPVPIQDAVDPHRTPAAFLPFLAAHESVDLWYSDWSEERKRQMIAEAPVLARLKGTPAAAPRFLAYVDATILDKVSYPQRFVMGRAVIGRTPIGHPPFVARYLIKIVTKTPRNAFVLGRGVIGRHALKAPSQEPFKRAMAALRAAKAPETQYRVDFGYMRPLTLSDAPRISDNLRLGAFVARNKL